MLSELIPELATCDRMTIKDVELVVGGSTASIRQRLTDALDAVLAMMSPKELGDLLDLWREIPREPVVVATSLMGNMTLDRINDVVVHVDTCDDTIGSCNLEGLLVRLHPDALALPFWELRNLLAHELGHALQWARDEELTEVGADLYADRWSNPLLRYDLVVAS